jgi:gas vesicle protein
MRRLLIFTAGILAGATIGTAISLLFTPASGDEMRQSARARFRQILDESARAAAARRADLEAELQRMTHPPNSEPENAAG